MQEIECQTFRLYENLSAVARITIFRGKFTDVADLENTSNKWD